MSDDAAAKAYAAAEKRSRGRLRRAPPNSISTVKSSAPSKACRLP